MKELKSFLNESNSSYTVKGRTLTFTIDNNLCVPVMRAGSGKAWKLQYIKAIPEKDGLFGLYFVSTPNDNNTSDPLDSMAGPTVLFDLFNVLDPKGSMNKFDMHGDFFGLGQAFNAGEEVIIKF